LNGEQEQLRMKESLSLDGSYEWGSPVRWAHCWFLWCSDPRKTQKQIPAVAKLHLLGPFWYHSSGKTKRHFRTLLVDYVRKSASVTSSNHLQCDRLSLAGDVYARKQSCVCSVFSTQRPTIPLIRESYRKHTRDVDRDETEKWEYCG